MLHPLLYCIPVLFYILSRIPMCFNSPGASLAVGETKYSEHLHAALFPGYQRYETSRPLARHPAHAPMDLCSCYSPRSRCVGQNIPNSSICCIAHSCPTTKAAEDWPAMRLATDKPCTFLRLLDLAVDQPRPRKSCTNHSLTNHSRRYPPEFPWTSQTHRGAM